MASIKQKSERKYKIIVCNGYRLDGSKISKAKTITVPNSIPSKRIAQFVAHAAEEFEREFQLGYSEDADTRFEIFAESWLARQTHYAISTLAGYRAMLKRIYPIIGGVKLCQIKPITLENMMENLRKRVCKGRLIAESTAQKYLNTVSAVLQNAVRNDILPYNPARRVKLPQVEAAQQFIPAKEEMLRLIVVIQNEDPIFRTYFMLAIATGCRRGELAALRWTDFDEESGMLIISRSRSNVTGVGVVEGKTKNGKTRYIPLENSLRLLLLQLQVLHICSGKLIEFNHHIFSDFGGKAFHPDTFSKRFRKLLDENGFDRRFHLHTMRHFLASFLLNDGISNKVVADLLGHRDTGFLEKTYGHPLLEYGAKASQRISLFLSEDGQNDAMWLIKRPAAPPESH